MSGVHAQLLSHLIKRGIDHVSTPPAGGDHTGYVADLEMKSRLYEDSPFEDVKPYEIITVALTFLAGVLIYSSVKYVLGEVVATLAMIEQPRTLLLSETKDNKTEGLSEKERLLDEEVSVFVEKPITASIRGTLDRLYEIGGYTGRWRGLVISVFYHSLHAIFAQCTSAAFSLLVAGPFAFVLGSVLSTVLLARIHMTWTHIMISPASTLPWYKRVPKGRTHFKALVTPNFVFAVTQHLTVVLPLMTYFSFGTLAGVSTIENSRDEQKKEIVRLLATVATAAFVALALLLPASVTLTRVEASLLPEDVETIVHFDRTLGGAAANLVGLGTPNFRAVYDAAWRSFDKASRIRLIKFYVKYFAILCSIVLTIGMAIATEVVYFGGERLLVFTQSASAQMQLAGMN